MTAALCLTFDDRFIAHWTTAAPLFAAAGARVTFCICNLHDLTAAQIAALHDLQDAGHEIANHSRTHPRLMPYLEAHGQDAWLAREVDRASAEHRAAGFPATSFAAPFHATTPETRTALAARFATVRAGPPRGVTRRTMHERIYTGPQQVVDNLGSLDFRRKGHAGQGWTAELLDAVAQAQGRAVFTGHDIRPRDEGAGLYATLDDIEKLLDMAVARGLDFITLSDMRRPL